jgi:hypothetical protein
VKLHEQRFRSRALPKPDENGMGWEEDITYVLYLLISLVDILLVYRDLINPIAAPHIDLAHFEVL